MKKLLIVTLLSLTLLIGCGSKQINGSDESKEASKSEIEYLEDRIPVPDTFQIVNSKKTMNLYSALLYDKETKVEYGLFLSVLDSRSSSFTQLVNPDGTPKLYKGE